VSIAGVVALLTLRWTQNTGQGEQPQQSAVPGPIEPAANDFFQDHNALFQDMPPGRTDRVEDPRQYRTRPDRAASELNVARHLDPDLPSDAHSTGLSSPHTTIGLTHDGRADHARGIGNDDPGQSTWGGSANVS
jgi:hypothetical protein